MTYFISKDNSPRIQLTKFVWLNFESRLPGIVYKDYFIIRKDSFRKPLEYKVIISQVVPMKS